MLRREMKPDKQQSTIITDINIKAFKVIGPW